MDQYRLQNKATQEGRICTHNQNMSGFFSLFFFFITRGCESQQRPSKKVLAIIIRTRVDVSFM